MLGAPRKIHGTFRPSACSLLHGGSAPIGQPR